MRHVPDYHRIKNETMLAVQSVYARHGEGINLGITIHEMTFLVRLYKWEGRRSRVIGVTDERKFNVDLQSSDHVRIAKVETEKALKALGVEFVSIDDFMAVIEEKRCRYIKGDLRRNPIFCKNKAEKKYYCEDHFNTCHRRAESKNEK